MKVWCYKIKPENHTDGKQAKIRTFFKCLENNAFKYWYWENERRDWTCFEDYYGYVKQKIRSGGKYSYGHTFWSEVIR